jgi:hypothetical protein
VLHAGGCCVFQVNDLILHAHVIDACTAECGLYTQPTLSLCCLLDSCSLVVVAAAAAAAESGCRDPFLLEKPSADNGWRWRVMVGSNVDMGALAAQAAAEPPASPATPTAMRSSMTSSSTAAVARANQAGAAGAAADVDKSPGAAVDAGGEDTVMSVGRAEEERQQLKRAAAALAAAGWIFEGRGLPGGLTLGTATVYRSKGKELEGGERCS